MGNPLSEEEEVYQDEEENVTNEPDYDMPGDDYTEYKEEEQLITEESLNAPTHLIRLGQKIKSYHVTNKRGQKKGKQSRSQKKDKTPHRDAKQALA
jgi:hypothetical protein